MKIKSIINKLLNSISVYQTYRAHIEQRDNADHRRRMLSFYSQFCHEDSLCFDVGANHGNRVEVLLALNARVVAIEPQKSCVKTLQQRFGQNDRFYLVNAAAGEREGEASINISSADTLSSMNPDWMRRVQESGRFSAYKWASEEKVKLITLDNLIKKYGVPYFVKIDVEGYEEQVLRGLTIAVKNISIEYTPELTDLAITCIDYLFLLGDYELNFSRGEDMTLLYHRWLSREELIAELLELKKQPTNWGDIYFRLKLG